MGRGETVLGVGAAVVAGALWTAVALTACAGSKPTQTGAAPPLAAHPEVDTGLETCAGCHQQATPEVAGQWKGGRHGMALVECFIWLTTVISTGSPRVSSSAGPGAVAGSSPSA